MATYIWYTCIIDTTESDVLILFLECELVGDCQVNGLTVKTNTSQKRSAIC